MLNPRGILMSSDTVYAQKAALTRSGAILRVLISGQGQFSPISAIPAISGISSTVCTKFSDVVIILVGLLF